MQGLSFLYDLSTIDEAATRVIEAAGGIRVILLDGQMGAGKTTLIKAICSKLGTTSGLSSPSYAIAQEYAIQASNRKVIHLDLYRLKSLEEALDIGIEDYLFGVDYCLIEWPDRILPLLRVGEYIQVKIGIIAETKREITIFR
jgi:tRNA threonylcarbamoyladenosine biosynthesis protein TsaE